MQYQVPQFIETEDTIIGPLTMRQFLYFAGAGIISFIAYFVFNTFLWVVVTLFVGVIAAILAFGKVSGRPVTAILLSAFSYIWKPKIYIWKRKEEIEAMRAAEAQKRGSPLQSLWLKITAGKEIVPKRERALPQNPAEDKERFQAFQKTTGERDVARRVDYR